MPALTREADKCTGHDACPPRPLATCSPDVIVNGRGAARVVKDIYEAHGCDAHAPHSAVIASGSGNTYINGYPAGRIGDPVSCGGSVAEGSPNVFVGG